MNTQPVRPQLERFKRIYSEWQLRPVRQCRDEIRAIKAQWFGYDDDYIESKIGDYLDQVYEAYQQDTVEKGLLTADEFDSIYEVIDRVKGYPGF